MNIYRDYAPIYRAAGWKGVLPIPFGTKGPPPVGYTGAEGVDPGDETIEMWRKVYPNHAIALRMPLNIIGIDIDHYADKHGYEDLRRWISDHGLSPFLPTWRSSAREAPSGISFYAVTPARRAASLSPSIEIIQHHHRYAVVWPSPHPILKTPYQWYTPTGQVSDCVPSIAPAIWEKG